MSKKYDTSKELGHDVVPDARYHNTATRGDAFAIDETVPYGDILYIPHDCVLPDPEQHIIGTVFRCRAYYNRGEGCYDLWELQAVRGNALWVRVLPRWKR